MGQFSKTERERLRAFAAKGAKVSQVFRKRLALRTGKDVFLNVGEKHFLLFWRLWSVCESHGVSVAIGCDLLLNQYAGEYGLGFQLRAVLGDTAMNRLHEQLQKLNPNGIESRKDAQRQKLNLKFPLVSRFRPIAYRERLAQVEAEQKRLREQAKVRPYRGCPWI